MKWPNWLYWHRVKRNGGYPVVFPCSSHPYTRWQGLYGMQIGSWFIGAVQGSVVSNLEPDVTVAITKTEAGIARRAALRAEREGGID